MIYSLGMHLGEHHESEKEKEKVIFLEAFKNELGMRISDKKGVYQGKSLLMGLFLDLRGFDQSKDQDQYH